MDSIDTVALFFDYQYFTNSIDNTHSTDWLSGFEHYEDNYLPKCVAPNKEFAAEEKLLYTVSEAGEKECNLNEWLEPIGENSLDKIKPYLLFQRDKETGSYIHNLIKNNLQELVQHVPDDVEKLLVSSSGNMKSWVFNALSNKPDYPLSEESIKYLENEILAKNAETRFIKPAVKILTNYVIHYQTKEEHLNFLVDLAKKEDFSSELRELIFKEFSQNVQGLKHCDNSRFDSFASLLPYDGDSHFLAKGLLDAQKYHGYVLSLEKITFLEPLLAKGVIKEVEWELIGKSLGQLLSKNDASELGRKEQHILNLYEKTGKLPLELIDAIFEVYKNDQTYFNGLIVNLIAEEKLLPEGLLKKLVEPLVNIKDPKNALFIASKLAQHDIDLPWETLKHFISFFKNPDSHVSELAIDFYEKVQIPGEINFELAEALLTLLPTVNEFQHNKISGILDKLNFTPDQEVQREILKQLFGWNQGVSFEKKDKNNEECYDTFNKETDEEWIPSEKLSPTQEILLIKNLEYLINQVQWSPNLLLSLIQGAEQDSLPKLIQILEKIADYKVGPEAIDRDGVTASEVLKNFSIGSASIEALSQSINRLINDDHYYINKDVGALLKEIKELNQGNSRLLALIDNNYFSEQLFKIGYELEISIVKPNIIKAGRLYLYKEGNAFLLETSSELKKVDLSEAELKQLNKVLETKILTKGIEALIFKKAFEAGITADIKSIKPVLRGSSKPLSVWKTHDFLEWRKTITEIDDNNIAGVIAVISQAAHNVYLKESYPRPIQLISILSLFKSPEGGLAQIATGEGKSLIVACLAILKVLEGRQVDIVTSSSILAQRDVEDLKNFYAQFGISVSHNIGSSDPGKGKKCYVADVVYGDLLNFIGDTLRDLSSDIKLGRGFDTVIVDEVDNMFIDQNNMKVQLAESMPGFDALMPLYVYMHGRATAIASMLHQDKGQCFLKVPDLTEDQKKNIENFDPKVIENEVYKTKLVEFGSNCNEYIKDDITNYTKNVLFAFQESRADRLVLVPKHLEGFVEDQLPKWVDTLMASYFYEENYDYLLYKIPDAKSRYQFDIIAPIDYGNTGVIQHGLQWSDGLHQFLQVKHGLTMYPENVVSVFMSYLGFFNKYTGNIYGVTGTLGQEAHKEFLQNVYGVELSVMPTFITKDLTKFQAIVVDGKEKWQQEIVDTIQRKIERSRAALVIIETIGEVESFKEFLESTGYDKSKIFVYGTASKKEKEYDVERKRELQPGDVIIATNMAGRGTDLKISPEVKKNGGLHVIMGTLAKSIRIQDQGFERAARQGEPGSAQMIVNFQQIYTQCNEDIDCLIKERNEKEILRLKEDMLCRLPLMAMRDKAFDLYVDLLKEIDSPTNYKLIIGKPEHLEDRSLYLYAENKDIILKIVQGKESENKRIEPLNITELLNTIDPRAAKHIRTVLSDGSRSASSLNKQDYEIIHFIATVKGYTDYPEIYNRVKYEFNWAVKNGSWQNESDDELLDSPKNAYLATLLKNNTQFADLQVGGKITESALTKAEIRKQYLLWVSDRSLYNNKYEISQIREDFGIWLKKHDDLFEQKNCQIGNETQTQESHKQLWEQLKREFDDFRTLISQQKDMGELMKNPSYLVSKAWQYFGIAQQQSLIQSKMEAEAVSGGWYDYFSTFVEDVISTYSEYFKGKRVNVGGENYDPINPLKSAKEFAENATKLDDLYAAWTAYSAIGYIGVMKDGEGITELKQAADAAKVKQAFCDNMTKAITKLKEVNIPSLDAQLTFLILNKHINYQDDLAIQLIGLKQIYQEIIARYIHNMDTVAKSSGQDMIEIGRFIPFSEVVKDINITESILNAANKTGDLSTSAKLSMYNLTKSLDFSSKQFLVDQILLAGGYVFEIATFELYKEEKDWSATIFAVAIGVASICTGLWMITAYGASSVFAATLGSSLIMQGTGDLIQSLVSVGTGNPIDFSSYINAKGISIGVALVTAGMLQFADMIPAIHGLGFIQTGTDKIVNAAADTSNFLSSVAAVQATTAVVTAVLQQSGKHFVDSEDIKDEAEQVIRKITEESHKEELNRIYATDEINENRVLQDRLHQRIEHEVYRHQGKFHDDKTQFGVGLAANIAGYAAGATALGNAISIGNTIHASTQFTMGMIKNDAAMRKLSEGTKNAIKDVHAKALSSGAIMQHHLNKDFSKDDIGNQLFAELNSQGYVKNGEINYKECDKFNNVKLNEALAGHKNALVNHCKKVGELLLKARDYGELHNKFINLVGGLKIATQNEMVGAVAGAVGGEVGQRLGQPLGEFIGKKVKEGTQSGTKGSGSSDQSKFEPGREKVDQKEIAQQTGLNKKPATGQTTERGERSEGAQNNNANPGMAQEGAPHEVKHVAGHSDSPRKVEGGGSAETEYKEFVPHQREVEIGGKKYLILAVEERTYSKDEHKVLREELQVEVFEIVALKAMQDGFLGAEKKNFETIHRGSEYIKNDIVNNIHEIARYGEFWDSNAWFMPGKLEVRPLVKSELQPIGEPRILSQTDFSPTEIMPEQKPQDNAGGGPIGVGLLSMEDAKLMREFLVSTVVPKTKELAIKVLSNPRFQGSVELVDGVGEMLVGSAVAAGTGASVVGFAGGVFILLHGASQASKGLTKIWTNKEIESVTSIAMQQLGVPKEAANTIDDMILIVGTVGGSILKRTLTEGIAEQTIKEAIKESAESIPMAGKTKLGAKEIELLEKADFKAQLNSWDLGKKTDSFATLKNFEYYTKYKVETELHWGSEFNDWLKNVDANYLQRHHVLSNKGDAVTAIRNNVIFKDGLLDIKLLDSSRNIMPLPTKPGMHPTMNVHAGGAHTKQYKMEMNLELDKLHMDFESKIITKDQVELKFWKVVNEEKTRLYKGESNIYHKKGE